MRWVMLALLLTVCTAAFSLAVKLSGTILHRAGSEAAAPPGGEPARGKDATAAVDGTIAAGLRLAREVTVGAATKDAVQTLTGALVTSHQAALDAGVKPIPPAVRRKLVGFFPQETLDRVHYRVGWGESRSPLASLFLLPQVKAVTVGDIIVFRDASREDDIRIWVHELGHVAQYDRWGTEGFAQRYVQDSAAVEKEAWDLFDRYDAWARDKGRLAATNYEPTPVTR